jgi:flavin-dependent dehydrogenase
MAAGRVGAHAGEDQAPPARFAATLSVGDAAAMIAPLCGDGISMAIRSGMIAADTILEGLRDDSDCRARFAARWRREIAPRLRVGGLLHQALQRPWLTRALSVSAVAWPPLVSTLFRNTRDGRSIAR